MDFIPKPFVFENMITTGGWSKVYLPGRSCITYHIDRLPTHTYACLCVHLCDKFFAYPTLKWGIRCIPTNAKCPFGGRCHGARIMVNGKPTNKSIDLNYDYIDELTKPQKTR